MKIALFYASDYSVARFGIKRKEFPPLGLLSLATVLKEKNYQVEIFDLAKIDIESVEHFDVIGLSINTSYIYTYFESIVKQLRDKARLLVIGGQHASIFPKDCLDGLNADYVVMGEGEESFPNLLQYIESKAKISEIPGLAYYDNNSNFIINDIKPLKDINKLLPVTNRKFLSDDDILLNNRIPGVDILSITMITSRGCPYNCAFCGNMYKQYRGYSQEKIEMEIQYLVSTYNFGGVVFLDENLMYSTEHILNICRIMKKYGLKWTANARVDSFSYNIAREMKASGCIEIKYGIESGSQSLLNRMNKQVTISQIEQAIIKTKEIGMKTKAFLLYGFPGENIETAKETVELLERLKGYLDRVNIFGFTPLPNSDTYRQSNKYNITLSKNFRDYRIYYQFLHWWGDNEDYKNMLEGYEILNKYVLNNYNEQ